MNKEERFLRFVNKTETCWLWIGAKHYSGYGQFWSNKKQYAHRISWEIYNGDIPKNLDVLHKCDIRECVNPLHLFIGSHQDNMRDKVLKGRQPHGEMVKGSKLTDENIREIKNTYKAYEFGYKKLSKIYGVCWKTIQRIIRGEKWAHIHG